MKLLLLLLSMTLSTSGWAAVTTPVSLTAGVLSQSNSAALYWANDNTHMGWYIYVNGSMLYQPTRADTGLSGTTRTYGMLNLPKSSSLVVTMQAYNNSGVSAISAAVTITGNTTNIMYVVNAPGTLLGVSGTGGGGGGDATAANQVIGNASLSSIDSKITVVNTGAVSVSSSALPAGASTAALQTTGNTTLSNIQSALSNVTVNTHAVTQGGPFTVSGSVGVTSFPASFIGVSLKAQDTPLTVSGSVGVTSWTAAQRIGVSLTAISATERLGVSITAVSGFVMPVSGTANDNADGKATVSTGLVGVDAHNAVFNGTTWDRQRGDTNGTFVKNTVPLRVLSWLGITNTAGVSAVQYASITFTAVGGAANGITIASAVSGKTIAVLSYTLSTDAAARLTLHHQGSAAVRSNTASNIIGGGLFPANGGESKEGIVKPGLAQNQPVCLDVSAAANVECAIAYITY